MKLIDLAGPPSSGKTSVILRLIEAMGTERDAVGVVKFDCLTSFDYHRYEEARIMNATGYSGKFRPDHLFVSNIGDAVRYMRE